MIINIIVTDLVIRKCIVKDKRDSDNELKVSNCRISISSSQKYQIEDDIVSLISSKVKIES